MIGGGALTATEKLEMLWWTTCIIWFVCFIVFTILGFTTQGTMGTIFILMPWILILAFAIIWGIGIAIYNAYYPDSKIVLNL